VGTAKGELGEVGEFVLGVIERMDLGPFTIAESDESDLLIYDVRGPAAQELVEGDGRVVDALQLLANQCSMQAFEEPPRVVVDMEGESASRESFLSNLAQQVARRARDTGRSQRLDPMNANDRRLIHVALRDEDGVATMSDGEGRYRQVIVVPEGAEEYDEARKSSR
jgi:spoIIIJ-associated protein